jgi:hypothetical protein
VTVGTIVNLNRVKKRAARERAENESNANRIKFGRTKAERASDEKRESQLDKTLEQHRIDREVQP